MEIREIDLIDPPTEDNEVYWTLIGWKIGKYWVARGCWGNIGSPCRVSYDFQRVWDWNQKHLGHKIQLLGFYHTHPHMDASPSSQDYRAMAGATVAFGRPLACLIEGVNGLRGHWFIDDETPHMTLWAKRFGKNLFIGRLP